MTDRMVKKKSVKIKRGANKPTPAQARAFFKKAAPPPRMSQSDKQRLATHVGMIIDPCNAPLGHNAYRGQDGTTSKFTVLDDINSGGNVLVYVFWPKYNSIYKVATTSLTSAITPSWGGNQGPGKDFITNVCASIRPVGACMTMTYNGSELNRQGLVSLGVVKVSDVLKATTPGDLVALVGRTVRTPDGPLEMRWSPSPSDETYWYTDVTSGPNDANGDSNAIVVVTHGFADYNDFTYTSTAIFEWVPKPTLGLSVRAQVSHDVPAGLEKVRNALTTIKGWDLHVGEYVDMAKQAFEVGSTIARLFA